MEHVAGHPLRTVAALTTAGVLALTPITVAGPELSGSHLSTAQISTQVVQLSNAWTELVGDTIGSLTELSVLARGADSNFFPLPSPTIFVAPIVTQLVLNQLIYAVQLFSGQGGNIPVEISTHVTDVIKVVIEAGGAVPGIVFQQLATPFVAARDVIEWVINNSNPVQALFDAPAAFLNLALNGQTGLLGVYGPIGLPIVVRNLIAKALYTQPPAGLPFKKAAAKTPKPKAAAVSAPSGTASSARSKPKSSPNSSRKATSAKTGTKSAGAHSKRR